MYYCESSNRWTTNRKFICFATICCQQTCIIGTCLNSRNNHIILELQNNSVKLYLSLAGINPCYYLTWYTTTNYIQVFKNITFAIIPAAVSCCCFISCCSTQCAKNWKNNPVTKCKLKTDCITSHMCYWKENIIKVMLFSFG